MSVTCSTRRPHDPRAGLKQAAKTKKYRIASFDIEDIRRTLKEG